jgi:GR25 family glycosyltransferase involved in LPS biosynthesis
MIHYWINLDKSTKRKLFMENQFKEKNIDNVRVSAITPDDFDTVLANKRPLTCKHPGCVNCEYEFACISSHIKAMKEAIMNTNDEWFVVMEDDMLLPYDIDYDTLIKDAPPDFEILQLCISYGNTVEFLYNNLLLNNKLHFIKWQYLLPCAGMYIVSRKGAEKLVNKFYVNGKYDFSSCEFQIVADVALYSTANTYTATFPCSYPNIEMGSEIHPHHLDAHQSAIIVIKNVLSHAMSNKTIKYLL